MDLNKNTIDTLIAEFNKIKNDYPLKQKNLSKFNLEKGEDLEFLSYTNGVGGYYIKFLNFLVKKIKPKVVVELGNREGLSTLSLYDACEDLGCEFYTIDIEKDQRYCPQEMFQNKQTHFLFGDVCSYNIFSKIKGPIDILFSDTVHFKYQIEDEFSIYQHLLADKALVAIDDIKTNDKGLFFDSLTYEKWDLTELCHTSGWGLFLFERKKSFSEEDKKNRAIVESSKIWERKYTELFNKNQQENEKKINNFLKKKIKNNKKIYSFLVYVKNKVFTRK